MAQTIVSLVVKTLGVNKLRGLKNELKGTAADAVKASAATDKFAKATRTAGVNAAGAANGIRGFGSASKKAAVGVRSLEAAAAKIAVIIGTVQTAVSLFNTSIERTESERRLELIGAAYGEAGQLAEVAARSAEKFGQSQTEVNNALASTFTRLRPLGVGLADIESTFNGFNTAARLSGATAQESANAFLQLSQALGSGRLAGDEFRSVAEQAPLVLQAISDETGVAVGELKNFAAEGQLTSDIVIKALKRIETEGADQLAETLGGPRQAFVNLRNSIENLFADVGKIGEDGLVEVVNRITAFVNAITNSLDVLAPLIGNLISLANAFGKGFIQGFSQAVGAVEEAGTKIKQILAVVAVVIGDLAKVVQNVASIIGRVVGEIVKFIGGALTSLVSGIASAGSDIVKIVSDTVRNVGRLIGNLVNAFSGLPGGILKLFGIDAGEITARPFFAVADGIDAVGTSVKNYISSVGTRANDLVFGGGVLPEGGALSGSTFDTNTNLSGGGGGRGRSGGGAGKAVKDITKDVEALVRKANDAASSFDSLFASPQNALEAEISSLNDELLSTDRELENILIKLDELTQGDPRFDGARSQVSALREGLSGLSEEDIRKQASRNLTKGDREELEQSIREAEALSKALGQGRTELTAVEKLAVKYGEAWEQLDPAVKLNLERLAKQKDQLDQSNKAALDAIEAQKQAAAELDSLYKGIGGTIENGIIRAIDVGIDGLIDGTKDLGKALQEIASGVLKDIGKQLISFGVKGLLNSTGLPGFAEGGRPEVGKPAIVGERGPELFIPDSAGTVVPNDEAFNDARSALVDVGSRPATAEEDTEAFAVAAGALARNSEIINNRSEKQTQSVFNETMMNAASSGTQVNYSGPRLTFNEADYVPAAAVPEIVTSAVKQSTAKVFADMKNRPSVRRSIGMG